jgi:hypothetical protein
VRELVLVLVLVLGPLESGAENERGIEHEDQHESERISVGRRTGFFG